RQACKMGCVLCVLAAMMFYGGFVERTVSFSAMLMMWAACFQMCRDLYRLAEGDARRQRRMEDKARRKCRMWDIASEAIKMERKPSDSYRNGRF
ncbi:MAG: hypothetical protein NC311_08840, partial [Muribaculaceae bacterium]|nr:hypothetical protein [Muribaculaceae bacterium]